MLNSDVDLSSLRRARSLVDSVFQLVAPDDLYYRPLPLRHRLIFYLGHLEAFDVNLLCRALPDLRPSPSELDRLFAFGIDPDSTGAPTDEAGDWPESQQVSAYCEEVRELIDTAWSKAPAHLRHVALEHRLMHAETLAYMLHAMPPDRLRKPAETVWGEAGSKSKGHEIRSVPAGPATLGQVDDGTFGWDNEFPSFQVEVSEFAIDRLPVTNGDYLAFTEQGGPPPHFWVDGESGWRLRTMFGVVPLPLDWPVYVTHEQASAYASWRGGRLPAEAEWHRAAYGTPDGDERPYPWGDLHPECVPGNFDSRGWDPAPVGAHPETASAFGVEDLIGNGWEWTSTPFAPFPGFEPFPFYPGYSADFFDGQHFVLKGGSPRTDAVFLRRSFRNWFRLDYPYVFATFRCVYKLK